jgi:Ca2+-binding EF-hand superfamily protein
MGILGALVLLVYGVLPFVILTIKLMGNRNKSLDKRDDESFKTLYGWALVPYRPGVYLWETFGAVIKLSMVSATELLFPHHARIAHGVILGLSIIAHAVCKPFKTPTLNIVTVMFSIVDVFGIIGAIESLHDTARAVFQITFFVLLVGTFLYAFSGVVKALAANAKASAVKMATQAKRTRQMMKAQYKLADSMFALGGVLFPISLIGVGIMPEPYNLIPLVPAMEFLFMASVLRTSRVGSDQRAVVLAFIHLIGAVICGSVGWYATSYVGFGLVGFFTLWQLAFSFRKFKNGGDTGSDEVMADDLSSAERSMLFPLFAIFVPLEALSSELGSFRHYIRTCACCKNKSLPEGWVTDGDYFVNDSTNQRTLIDPRIATEQEVAGRLRKMRRALETAGPNSPAYMDEMAWFIGNDIDPNIEIRDGAIVNPVKKKKSSLPEGIEWSEDPYIFMQQMQAYRREQNAQAAWAARFAPDESESRKVAKTKVVPVEKKEESVVYTAEYTFSELDVDGDGTLSKSEVRAAFEHFAGGQPIDEEDFNARFKKMDKAGTGQITLEQFKKGVFYQKIVFKLLDVDVSGSLDKEEARQAWSSVQGVDISDEKFDEGFAKMDQDGDGSITFKEFRKWMNARVKASS